MNDLLIFPQFLRDNFLCRLFLASLLGAIIGLERDIHGRAAGLRTNLLVSLGAATFMVISEYIAVTFSTALGNSILRADPGRIAAQIITGIGFLGAGAIVKSGFAIRGLTTAACLWISAGVGMCTGAGYYELAMATTFISIFALITLHRWEKYYARDSYRYLEILTTGDADASVLQKIIERKHLKIIFMDSDQDFENNTLHLRLYIRLHHKDLTDNAARTIIADLREFPFPIKKIRWRHE